MRLPDLPPAPIADGSGDFTPVSETITADWLKVSVTVPAHDLRSVLTLWEKMNFDDWDTVTQRLREDGLSAIRYVNADGHRDIGLGGFSEYCRRTLERLAGEGAVDFNMRGEDDFDPWRATPVVAVWFERMLQEANGDFDLAIRAYHRGSLLARRGEGTAYLANIKRLRQRPAGLRATPSTSAGGRRWTSERNMMRT